MSAPPTSELAPEPEAGRVYSASRFPGGADVGPGGRMRLDAIARWLQDIAFDDMMDSGFDQGGVWILRRARIAVERFPRFGERLELRTFCSGLGRFSAQRRTSIRGTDGAEVEAVGLWAFFDPVAGRPVRLEPALVEEWAETAGDRGAKVRLHHPPPPPDAAVSSWEFRATELDLVEHVNNSNYWVPLEEELARVGEEPDAIDAEIEFHQQAPAGPVRVLRTPAGMWIASPEPDGPVYASILLGPGA